MQALGAAALLSGPVTSIINFFGGGFDEVNRKFEFTFENKTGISLELVSQDCWYGFLDAPNRTVPAGGELKIRGYKRADNATGVTYLLGF